MNESLLLDALAETDLHISRAMLVTLDRRWGFSTLGSAYSRLYFVTEGGGFLKTEDQYIEMTAGNVYLIPANCSFSCGCEHMEKIFFHFVISTPEKYELSFSPCRIASLPCPEGRLDELRSLLNTREHVGLLRLKLLLLETVSEFFEKTPFERSELKDASPLVRSVIAYVEEHTAISLSVSDVAAALYLSESKIRSVFRRELGIPIGKYVDDMVFIKARQMLSDPKNTIASVSAELGFCDPFYFSRRFKEKFSITPSKFKLQNSVDGTGKNLKKTIDTEQKK